MFFRFFFFFFFSSRRRHTRCALVTGVQTCALPISLIVRFDQERIDDIAAALGVPVWPQPRPKPVLWLAIDDGSGPRLVDVGSADAARSTLDRAIERGYRLGLPGGSATGPAAVEIGRAHVCTPVPNSPLDCRHLTAQQ